PRTAVLRKDARANLELIQRLRLPTFISTPDLEFDVPTATWCPVIVDVDRFATSAPLFASDRPRVVHVSSNAIQKGSDRINPALAPLMSAQRLDYELIAGVPSEQMPETFASADIVLDQFRLGSYGAA